MQVLRRGAFADAARNIVVRAVAGAEPAAEITARLAGLGAEWNAAEMRADAFNDEPFGARGAVGVPLRIAQVRGIIRFCPGNFLGRAVTDKNRRAAPYGGNRAADGNL